MTDSSQRSAMEAFVSLRRTSYDPQAFSAFFADSVVFTHWRWRGGEVAGKDNVTHKYFDEILKSFDEVRFEILDAIYGDDKLVLRGEFSATFARDWGSVKAHGRRISYFAHDIYEFRDGKIVRAWFANDTLRAARQLGVVPDDGQIVGFDSMTGR